jgi:hypothetical protein
MTLLDAASKDLGDALLDGNDDNNLAAGTGLEIGDCPAPSASCSAQPSGCQLGACRPSCSVYTNTYRGLLSQATTAFIGTREFPSVWNRTTLGAQDARTMLDQMARNTDADLFGDACLETTDRLPPSIAWRSPADGLTVFKGDVTLSIAASDDSGGVRAYFVDLTDEDADVTNNVARTTLHTAGEDRSISVTAAAIDMGGNERRITRVFETDNTVPAITVDNSAFIVDARAWWTTSTTTTLRGTVVEAHPKSITVTAGAMPITVTMTGTAWSAELPAGTITSAGTLVTVQAEDLAGNVATSAQTLRLDIAPPVSGTMATTVKDERADVLTFANGEPSHRHDGPPVTLGDAGCPDVYKYAYLLDENLPLYGRELGARNPLLWAFQLADDGVGLNLATTQYRVRVAGADGAVLLDWTTVQGEDAGGGLRRMNLPLYRTGLHAIPALGTYEGAIEIDLKGADRLGNEVTGTRCWTHHPLAAPLDVGNAYNAPHALALNAHGLESGRIQDLSSLLLNDTTTGVSTMDAIVSNGTAEVVYLKVALTAPTTANATRRFAVAYDAVSSQTSNISCGIDPDLNRFCDEVPPNDSSSPPDSFPGMPTPFEVRLYTASASGAPIAAMTPCSDPGCVNTAMVRTYRLEGRTSAAEPARYVAMAWLHQAVALRPSDAEYPAAPPFAEFVQGSHGYTGKQSNVTYCTATTTRGIPSVTYCVQRTTYQRRQSLSSAGSIWNERSLRRACH